MARISRTSEQFALRLPEGLRDRVKELAETNRRSMNAEIIFHLEKAAYDEMEMKKADARA